MRALKLAAAPSREALPVSARHDRDSSHEVSAHDRNVAAVALAVYLKGEIAALGSDDADIDRRSEELISVLLVQRELEEAKSLRLDLDSLEPQENGEDG